MTVQQPLISVIIPSWNHGDNLLACLMSLEGQTHRSFEVIVVDDGSTDGSAERVRQFRASYLLRLVELETNMGAAVARNRGFRYANGEYVIFLDADANPRPHMLERMFSELQKHQEADFVYSAFRFGWKLFKGRPWSAEELRKRPYIHTSSLMRKRAFPGFDETLKKFQDWDLWLTMAERGSRGIWIPEELFSLSVRRGGMSKWLPSIVHKLPWHHFGFMPRELRNYRKWEKVVKEKHEIAA